MRHDDGTLLAILSAGVLTLGAAVGRRGSAMLPSSQLPPPTRDDRGLQLSHSERVEILSVARRAGLPMPDESSGEVALAIQDVLLGGRGKLMVGVNTAEWQNAERPVGAVGVLYDGTFWTAHGGDPWTRDTQESFLDESRMRGIAHTIKGVPEKHKLRRLRTAVSGASLLEVDRDWLHRYGLTYTRPSPFDLLYDLRNRVLARAQRRARRQFDP
jgi:hypothetical protein